MARTHPSHLRAARCPCPWHPCLPPDVVAQFKGKTMAITGYESDQVRRTPTGDVPLPITAAYNHHYGAILTSASARRVRVGEQDDGQHGATMGHPDSNGDYWEWVDTRPARERTGPASVVLHEGNGGEYRQSFHGYPTGFAQLVESPEQFVMQPMQIDTWNRDNKGFDGFWPGPQPVNSAAPRSGPNAVYSGLLECPCTDRITKEVNGALAAQAMGRCPGADAVHEASQCTMGALQSLGLPATVGKVVAASGSNASMPPGCSLTVDWQVNVFAAQNETQAWAISVISFACLHARPPQTSKRNRFDRHHCNSL